MIRRLYVHNFRCFENLDLNFANQSSVLLLGKNGAGKSSLASVLRLLQSIALGRNRIRDLLKFSDFAFDRRTVPVRIEVTAELSGKLYDYKVAFELPEGFKEARIRDESLSVDGATIYTRQEAQVDLTAAGGTRFLVDWHVVALTVVQVKGSDNPLEKFRSWLASLVLIAPQPSKIESESLEDSLHPTKTLDNFADWFCGVLSEYPATYSTIADFLRRMMPDFHDFQNKTIGETTKKIIVRFSNKEHTFPLSLDRLSDGEKIFFVCAVLLAVQEQQGPLFCFWDEPDNFVSISEVAQMVMTLRKAFKESGQILVTSHNPESIRQFTDESTLLLTRRSHLEPTVARWVDELEYHGDLVNSLIRGDLENDGVE